MRQLELGLEPELTGIHERVAVVGSREFKKEGVVRRFVQSLRAGTVVVTGGARGVDSWAADEARECGLDVVIHEADWDKHGRAAGPIRNSAIVADSHRGVAFWDGKSRGAMDTVRKMRNAGKNMEIVR